MIKPNKTEQEILKLVKKHEPINKYQLWKKSGYYSYSIIWNNTKNLIIRGLIKQTKQINKKGKLETTLTTK